jgi:phage gp29-like protein
MDRNLRLLTPQNMIDGEAVPDRKFICFTYGSSDNPFGEGLGQKLWWPVGFKKHGIKYWLIFLEKFGMPTAHGKYPPGTDPADQAKLLDAIDAMQNETGITTPDTMKVDLIEATRAGNATYETICEYMDKQMSKAVLGQTATTEGTPGKLGNEDAQQEVRQELKKADADMMSETINTILIPWIVDYNVTGVTEYPTIWLRTEKEKDLKPLAERDKILVNDIGVKVPESYFYDTYGIPQPEGDEPVVGGALRQAQGPITVGEPVEPAKGRGKENNGDGAFSEPRSSMSLSKGQASGIDESPAATLGALGKKALDAADLSGMIDPVRDLLSSVSSLEEFRDRLIDLYPDMNEKEFADILSQALTTADLAGRYDAQ